MRRLLFMTCTVLLTACVAQMPSTGLYENPVRRNYRQQYLAQNPQLPPDMRAAIESQRIIEGMPREAVMAAWGPPSTCSRIGIRTVCIYTETTRTVILGRTYRDTDYNSVTFEHGRAVDWQLH
jgi:hypothetical protein